ncbi:MAG TPA: PQQ-binding-like beta-propeller repeat protein [Candidatus Anammoximicrobium sp.]|nr:PQQ-binding-like beta-propeller repeat protein [Candidatus Anammoximicrobium sp.]
MRSTIIWLVLTGLAAGGEPIRQATDDAAAAIVRVSGKAGGIIAVVEPTESDLAVALAKRGSFLVHCLTADQKRCDMLRQAIRAEGLYGTVSVSRWEQTRLPYAGNLINVVVIPAAGRVVERGLATQEVERVLAPLGTAFVADPDPAGEGTVKLDDGGRLQPLPVEAGVAWRGFRKPWPAEIDQWTHYLHGSDGNPVAQDTVVGPPVHLQWVGGPRWLRCHETDSSVSSLVTAQGRLFAIVDEAPISLVGQHSLPDKWFLIARDAFNGTLLWKVPIRRWGWREWKPIWFNTRPGDIPLNIQKRLVAVDDFVYVTLGYQAPVVQLDARTGEIVQTYAGTERTGEILHHDGTLFLSMLDGSQVRVVAIEAATGKRLWTSPKTYRGSTVDYIKWKEMHGGSEPADLDPAPNMASDGRTIALLDGPEIVGLDAGSGKEIWRAAFPQDEADQTAGGIRSQGNLWIGTMIVRDGVVVHASPNKLAGFVADTGRLLWSQPKKYIGHLWYEWKDVFVIGDLVWTWSAELEIGTSAAGRAKDRAIYPTSANGYDLHTGELKKQMPLGAIFKANHHHRCYRNKATTQFILASRRGTEFVDLEHGQHTVDNWVRSTCHVGMMPANGLQYVPPHPCQCYIEEKLNGFLALAARRQAETFDWSASPRLEKGPAYEAALHPSSFIPHPSAIPHPSDDWPAYRRDGMRTGATKARLPDELAELWRVKIGPRLTPPIAVGDSVFVASIEDHRVLCLDARNGAKRWDFTAGGRVDSPPTYHQGRLLFGCADGWVVCLNAADGGLAWRLRAAPGERLIGADGQLESAWPVHGSVLVQNGVAYFTAGRSSHLDGGLGVYGVAADTGELRCQTLFSGPSYTVENLQENFLPPMGMLPDILMGDGERIYLRGTALDNDLKPANGKPQLQVKGGFLDDSYFKRTPWTFAAAQNYGRLIVHDDQRFYVVRMFDSLRGLDPNVFFTPADKGYLLFANPLDSRVSDWSCRVPVRIRAMLLAGDRLIAAGPPDMVDPQDPLGAFEGRKGGVLYVINAASGERLAEQSLPSPPVFNGAAAPCGRLFLAAENGELAAYGKQ